ncbi:MAG: starch-binding protein [Bacilli bacterium]|nr:starch-binding protein [Bacilli bacterium]
MKRKSIILLSSILAGSLLVGGAFAAYAVTDNADPFGVNVTPGNVDEDDTTYVTLEWGQATNLEGVGLIKVAENRKVGVVSLVSSQNYTGKFSLSIQDQTEETAEVAATRTDYLLDYLNVKVYEGDLELTAEGALPEGTPIASIAKSAGTTEDPKLGAGKKKSAAVNVGGTSAGKELSIFVTLDNSSSPYFSQMENDKVRLTVDWGKKDGDEEAEGKIVYFSIPTGWAKVYAYAWEGEKVNASYPGVEMAASYNEGLYQILIPTDLENIIFNNGLSGENELKTADISFDGYNANTAPYYNGSAWAAKPAVEEVSVISATKNGENIILEDVKAQESTDIANYKITLAVNDEIIFKDGNTTVHFYHWDSVKNTAVDDGTVYTATKAGEHTFYYNSDNEMYVTEPVQYYLVGTHNDWAHNNDSLLTMEADNSNHYFSSVIAFEAGAKIKVSNNTGETGYFSNASEWDGCGFTIDNEGNIVLSAAGNYVIDFYVVGNNNNHIVPNIQAGE